MAHSPKPALSRSLRRSCLRFQLCWLRTENEDVFTGGRVTQTLWNESRSQQWSSGLWSRQGGESYPWCCRSCWWVACGWERRIQPRPGGSWWVSWPRSRVEGSSVATGAKAAASAVTHTHMHAIIHEHMANMLWYLSCSSMARPKSNWDAEKEQVQHQECLIAFPHEGLW